MSIEARTFKELKKEKSADEFNRFAKEVTELYANSVLEYSQTNVARDNRLSKKALREVMDYAIKIALVSLDTAKLVLNKSIKNQQRKAKDAGGSSINHNNIIINERAKYLAKAYNTGTVDKIATDIATDTSKELSYFTRKYEIESDQLTKRILERSIIENIVSDEIMEKIIERTLKRNNTESARKYFENIRKQRSDMKKNSL